MVDYEGVYGASDDCIEIDCGTLREEFYLAGDDDDNGDLLAFSDGTVLRIKFDGVWRIDPVVKGPLFLGVEKCAEDNEDRGTDVATFGPSNPTWVVHGTEWGKV